MTGGVGVLRAGALTEKARVADQGRPNPDPAAAPQPPAPSDGGGADYDLDASGGGLGLRAEMGVQEFMLKHGPRVLVLLAVGVVAIGVYGWWRDADLNAQRAAAARIAAVEADLPADLLQLAQGRAGIGSAPDPAEITDEAERLMAIGDESRGTVAVEAWLKAAELYRLADDPAGRRAALDKAATNGHGVLRYAAVAALANLDLEQDKADEGIARLQALTTDPAPFLARQATLDLAGALHAIGRTDDARAAYARFLSTWPDAPEVEEAQTRLDALGEGTG